MTRRVLASAPEVHFSYARQSEGVEARPSRLVAQIPVLVQPLPAELIANAFPDPLTIAFDDATQLPYPLREVSGGATVLTTQSQCPFKAFATARLDAKKWDAAEAGLTASNADNFFTTCCTQSGPALPMASACTPTWSRS